MTLTQYYTKLRLICKWGQGAQDSNKTHNSLSKAGSIIHSQLLDFPTLQQLVKLQKNHLASSYVAWSQSLFTECIQCVSHVSRLARHEQNMRATSRTKSQSRSSSKCFFGKSIFNDVFFSLDEIERFVGKAKFAHWILYIFIESGQSLLWYLCVKNILIIITRIRGHLLSLHADVSYPGRTNA